MGFFTPKKAASNDDVHGQPASGGADQSASPGARAVEEANVKDVSQATLPTNAGKQHADAEPAATVAASPLLKARRWCKAFGAANPCGLFIIALLFVPSMHIGKYWWRTLPGDWPEATCTITESPVFFYAGSLLTGEWVISVPVRVETRDGRTWSTTAHRYQTIYDGDPQISTIVNWWTNL
jgi:hypothetical protein